MPDLDTKQETDRLTDVEADVLRERLGTSVDVRAHGAATVGDLAEALGVAPERVRAALSALRAERAMSPTGLVKTSQKTLGALAAVLFLVAGWIFYANWPVDEDARIDATIRDLKAKQARKLREHPPFPYQASSHDSVPGLTVSIVGKRCSATADSKNAPLAMTRQVARERLIACIRNLVRTVSENEARAPKDGKSPSAGSMASHQQLDGFYSITLSGPSSGTFGYIPTTPTVDVPAARLQEDQDRRIALFADGYLADAWKQQQDRTRFVGKLEEGEWLYPPPGFSITASGRMTVPLSSKAVLVPIDADSVQKRLIRSLHFLVDKCRQLPDAAFSPVTSREPSTPLRSVKITMQGPYERLDFDVPISPSPKYPTAADALRAADEIIVQKSAEARRQIDRLNKEFANSR